MPCEVHKVKLLSPVVSGPDVIRQGNCQVCGVLIEVVYGFAGAFTVDGKQEDVAFEEVE